MTKIYLVLILFMTLKTYSQIQSSVIDDKLDEIKDISYRMKDSLPKRYTAFYPKLIIEFRDSALTYLINQDAPIIPLLIETIIDTSLTSIKKSNSELFFRKGDLAIIVISYIEFIPFARLTGDQWCTCCDGGYLPSGFLNYVEKDRIQFQSKYKEYFLSDERKESIRENAKYLKKYMKKKRIKV